MCKLVSVIIPVYNDEQHVADAIESALLQTLKDVEVIVVDDGSTDGTPEVLEKYEGRIVHIRQENRGLPGARNTGIKASRGKYLCFLDSDDTLLHRKVEVQAAVLEKEPEVGLCYAGWLDVDIVTGKVLRDFSLARPEHDSNSDVFPPHFPVFSVMVRREWFDKVGLFDERLKALEDSDMWWRLWAAGCVFRRVKVAVARRGVRPGSMSQNVPEHSKCALFANRQHFARMGHRAPRPVRVRKLASIWMKQAGYYLSRSEPDLAVDSLLEALRYDRRLLESPMHWVPLVRQLDLKYPLAKGNGIEDYSAAWRGIVSAAHDALARKLARKRDSRHYGGGLSPVKSALAYAMSRQAFSTGRIYQAFRWLAVALVDGRGHLPQQVDWATLKRFTRHISGRASTALARIARKMRRSSSTGPGK
ncbi:MAG TPA: glycosyltransferase [bacterium]|nr:glycosyltransferase [bacterium]